MKDEGRSVLITGASRGLGRALLEHYHLLGWQVLPLVRDAAVAEQLAAELEGCMPIVGDVAQEEVDSAISETLTELERLDVLINNAGIPGKAVHIDEVTTAEVEALFYTHCLGALRCVKAALPFMQRGKRIIVNVTSRFGSTTRYAAGVYSDRSISYAYRIAKASQNMLTVSLAQELGPRGFVVCGVHPGRLKTASGASDADTEPAEAATRLAAFIDRMDSTVNGHCFDVLNNETMEW
jgi:NAD(P)-dependent dehydrogenase (short-subunit alcohol dehydrogenase family)